MLPHLDQKNYLIIVFIIAVSLQFLTALFSVLLNATSISSSFDMNDISSSEVLPVSSIFTKCVLFHFLFHMQASIFKQTVLVLCTVS